MRTNLATALLLCLFALPAAAAISGSVMTTDGAPIAGARVSIYAPETPEARRVRLLSQSPARVPVESTQTDAKGTFSLPSPKDPVVELRIDAPATSRTRGAWRRTKTPARSRSRSARRAKARSPRAASRSPNATVVISYSGTDSIVRTDEQGRYDALDPKRASRITVIHPDFAIDEETFHEPEHARERVESHARRRHAP